MQRNTVVGHIPRTLLNACLPFVKLPWYRFTALFSCFSADLPQGGLAVSCTYNFSLKQYIQRQIFVVHIRHVQLVWHHKILAEDYLAIIKFGSAVTDRQIAKFPAIQYM